MTKQEKLDAVSHSLEKFPPRSAIKRIITEVPVAHKDDTVGLVLSRIKNDIHKLKTIDYVYIINTNKSLVGVISFKDLLKHGKEHRMENIMQRKLITASPETDQEKVADLAVKHNLKAIPIVKHKKLIGVVPIEQILPVLNRALREDVLHLAGIHKAHLKYENTLAVPLFMGVLHRIPYLLIGLAGITFAAFFVSLFEVTIQKYLILAFFIPAIVYMSGALGTQHQTLFVRDLAILGKELRLGAYFLKLMTIGSLLALLISGIIFFVTTLIWKQPFPAFVISVAMFSTLIVTSFTALVITLAIKRLKLDPALGSGPVATIISDITSIIIYFAVAVTLLG